MGSGTVYKIKKYRCDIPRGFSPNSGWLANRKCSNLSFMFMSFIGKK